LLTGALRRAEDVVFIHGVHHESTHGTVPTMTGVRSSASAPYAGQQEQVRTLHAPPPVPPRPTTTPGRAGYGSPYRAHHPSTVQAHQCSSFLPSVHLCR